VEIIVRRIALRLFQGIFVALGVSTLTFALLMAMPGDLALKVTMAQYGEDGLNQERVERVRRETGLDEPALWLYGKWVVRTLRFDLGRSMVTGQPVRSALGFHLGLSLKLASAAILFSLVLALPMGILAGLRPGSWPDLLSAAFSSLMVSLPGFVLGAFLILLLAIRMRLLPAAGFHEPAHMVLPAITLGLGLAAVSSRVIRTAVVDVKNAFYLQFARIKGVPEHRVLLDHGFRNGAVPVVTFLSLQLAHVLDGVVVLENLFNWPGIGFLLLESIQGRDIPMIQAVTLLIGLFYVGANLLADLACAWLDPRRLARGGEI
jgi:peptide/nickel transport system permease protein